MTEDFSQEQGNGEPPRKAPKLSPPDAAAEDQQKSLRTPLLIAVGGLLLLITALLVAILPVVMEKQTTPQSTRQASSLEGQAPLQEQAVVIPKATDHEAAEVEQLVNSWLRKQSEAEAENISAWGGESYLAASTRGRECSRLWQEKKYLPAKEACAEAIDILKTLMASKEVLLEDSVTEGLGALEQDNLESATAYFQKALAINADEERATAGLRRAEQRPRVLRFMREGQSMEDAGDPEGALRAFSEATSIDPAYLAAQQSLSRVKATVAEQEFQRAMSHALQALAEGRTRTAGAALQKAEAIKPGDRALLDLRQQLVLSERASSLTSLRHDAERMEREERWAEVLKTCTEALGLDSHAAFASSCKERASLRTELDKQFAAIFAKPERLFTDAPRTEARKTLLQASQVTPRGPRLASQIERLEALITEAEAEIEVVIISDGLTDVVIYHVGRLGHFEEKQLVLRTGNYTATGSRNGFRDVRQTLKIRPGTGKMIFTLRCEEPI